MHLVKSYAYLTDSICSGSQPLMPEQRDASKENRTDSKINKLEFN